MGVNISNSYLARTVSGHSKPGKETLGTVSGTAAERVVARILQWGWDEADAVIHALDDFPHPDASAGVIKKYHNKIANIPFFTLNPSRELLELTICANYALVKLAQQWHKNSVSVNYLEKISMPHLASIYGVMLAGGDYITMWAGIPIGIPAIFQDFLEGKEGKYTIPVSGSKGGYTMRFNPKDLFGDKTPDMKAPHFLPIVSTDTLATILSKKIPGWITGFIVETPQAGGHNAPPRGGKSEYGERDTINFDRMRDIWLPYWLAGSYASPEWLKKAHNLGAVGIQAGSIFALSEESGMRPDLRTKILEMAYNGELTVATDWHASPTGFPFKVAQVPWTLSDDTLYTTRTRMCNEWVLRVAFERQDGTIGYRCPGEPTAVYKIKWGDSDDTHGVKCLCNGLMGTAGLKDEIPIVTLGDTVREFVMALLSEPDDSYSACQAIDYIFWNSSPASSQ